jgi:hypothetical protein
LKVGNCFEANARGCELQGSFFPPNLLCSQTGDHQQEDLAKFGCITDMKFKNPFTFWLSARTCCKIIGDLKKLKIWQIRFLNLHQNPLYVSKLYF